MTGEFSYLDKRAGTSELLDHMLPRLFPRGPHRGAVIVAIEFRLGSVVRTLVKVGHGDNFDQHDPEKKPERGCTPMVLLWVTMGSLHGCFDRPERRKPDRGTKLQGSIEDCAHCTCHGCWCSLEDSDAMKP
jgi:hypothetical protein